MAATKILVGSTGNKPEIVDRVPIARAAAPTKRRMVVLSLGPDSKTDLPMPDVSPGDRLRLFAELEVTTDYQDPNDDGLIGRAYSYDPRLEATLLLAADDAAIADKAGRAVLVGGPVGGEITHEQHHRVLVFGDLNYPVPAAGIGWRGPVRVNIALAAAHPKAKRGNVLLVGQNQRTPVVGQDMAGIRIMRIRPGAQGLPAPLRNARPLVRGLALTEQPTVVFSQRLDGLTKGEQLLVKARLVSDSRRLGYPARISTRMFLADSATQVEPGGTAHTTSSWNGHLSKPNGFNSLPALGPMSSHKFGVLRVMRTSNVPLHVNVVAVGGDPTRQAKPGDRLAIAAGTFIEVTRIGAELKG